MAANHVAAEQLHDTVQIHGRIFSYMSWPLGARCVGLNISRNCRSFRILKHNQRKVRLNNPSSVQQHYSCKCRWDTIFNAILKPQYIKPWCLWATSTTQKTTSRSTRASQTQESEATVSFAQEQGCRWYRRSY